MLPVSSNGNIVNYNTADQSFMKVESHDYDPNDPDSYSFIAWTKDGTRYDFKETIDVRKSSANCNSITWRWSLSKVTDAQGNTLNFSYFTETKNDGCNSEISVYPQTITYGNGKYRVNFIREARTDYQTSWTTALSNTLYGAQRLKEVQIQQYNGTSWANIRRYVMSYAPNNATNIYPNFNFSNGGKTLTLVGVQEFGSDDSALPAVTFTYADDMHLTTVNNGQGGSVQMNYAAWQYYDDVNTDLRSVKTAFQTEDCINGPGLSPIWGQVSGKVRCDASKLLQVGDIPAISSVAERAIPEHMIKPSGKYSFNINVRAIQNTTNVNWGMRDTGTNQTTMLSASGINEDGGDQNQTLTMPVAYNPASTKLRLDCNNCFFRSFEFIQYVILYRVTSRTVTVQPGGLVSTYTYQYDNASPATADNSAAVASGGSLYTKKLREFRGNAMSQVTNPEGLTTVNWFWQADGLKGRAYDSLILKRDLFDSLESLNANWVTSGGTHTAAAEYQKDFDSSIKSVNTAANWTVSFSRASASISDGEAAVAHVRLSGANAQGEMGLVNGASFAGLTLSSSGAVASNGVTVLSSANFIKDEWYAVMIFVDANDQSRVRIWQLDNPNNSGETALPAMTGAWTFRSRINNGTIYTDSYFEGRPYSETITRFGSKVQYDTTAGGNIPDIPGFTYKDLAVTWVYPTSVENRNYNGDAAFVGTRQEFTYASAAQFGNLLTQVESGNDGSGWAAYRKTNYEYYPNAAKYIVSLPARQTVTDASNALLAETLYFYDNAATYTTPPTKGSLTTQRVWAGDDPSTGSGQDYAQTSMSYDAVGNVLTQSVYTDYGTATTDPGASSRQTTTTVYDTAGYNTYPIRVTNPLNQTVTTAYNYALGLPVSVTDANGVVTSAAYDGFGRMKTITAPGDSSPTLQVNYSDASIPFKIDLIQTVSASSAIRLSRFYDGAGRQIQTQTASAVVSGALQNIVVDTQYNAVGRMVKQTAPYVITNNAAPAFNAQTFSQPSTSTTYDVIGRATTTTAPNSTSVTYTYTDLATSVKDPNENSTTTTVDVWGRTLLVDAATGPDVSYQYDVLNRLTDATRAGSTTRIRYDALGRKTSMSDPDMGNWSYTYDALGNLKSQTDARNQLTCLYYDGLNRLDGKIYAASGGCGTPLNFDVDFKYDAGINGIGRRTSMSDASGSTDWTYDLRGRLSTETKVISDQSFITSWNYNTGDLPIAMTYPDGETVTYGYNSDGTLKNAVSNTTGDTYLNDMQYDEAGRLKLIQYGSNVINKTFNYFAWNTPEMGGLLASVTAASSSSLQNLSYTYDKNGNVLTIVDALAAGGPQTQTFSYDALNRISSAGAAGGTNGLYSESYAYDSASGNLSLKNGVSYTYGDPAHIHAATSLSNGNSYAYDANGNMITRTVGGQVFDLVYDEENRLTSVTAQGIPSPTPIASPSGTAASTETQTLTPTAANTPLAFLNPGAAALANPISFNAFESRKGSRIRLDPNGAALQPQQTDLLFLDGFESGDFTSWDTVYTDNGNMSVSTAAAAVGSYGVQTTANDINEMRVSDYLAMNEPRYRARFYFNPNNFTLKTDDRVGIFAATYANGYVFRLFLKYSGGSYWINQEYQDDSNIFTGGKYQYITDDWQAIEFDWQAATSPGANDGYLSMWINNTLVETLGSIDNDTYTISGARMGLLTSLDPGMSGSLYFDSFASSRTEYLGLDPNGPSLSAPSVPPDLAFFDEFESGDFSAWTNTATNSGNLAVTTGAAYQSVYGLKATISNTTSLIAYYDSPIYESEYHARFYFNPNSLSLANGKAHYIYDGVHSSTNAKLVRLEILRENDEYKLRVQVRKDDGTYVSTGKYTIRNDWQVVEVDWRAATSAGANNGMAGLWIDDTQMEILSGLDNDALLVNQVRLGAVSGVDTGTSGTMLFDSVMAHRYTHIGVVSTPTATLTPTQNAASTNTATVTNTSTPTSTPTATFTPTGTMTPSQTPTRTPVPTASITATPTATLLLAFTPVDDAYVHSGYPNSSYGSAVTLQVDNDPVKNFLIKFEVTGVNGQQVTNAKLRIYNTQGSIAGGNFYQVFDNTWQEETVTWSNAPTAQGALLASLGSVSSNNWYEADLTSLITGDGTYSLLISSTSTDGADYSSKEGANPPQLVVTLGGTPAPTGTSTSTATSTPTGTPVSTPTATSTSTGTPTYTPTQTFAPTFTFTPTFTATPTQPPVPVFASAAFTYDGDGKRVKSAMQTNIATTTTYFVGNYYEVTGSEITKYYFAGSQRIAMRKNGTLNFIIGDHLGSTSLVTDAAGVIVSQQQYKAWGEERYSSGTKQTGYGYTGQYSYESDFGLQFYNARWYDSSLGRFTSADTIVPGGVQGYDRYAYANNNPVKYTDPSGYDPSLNNCDYGGLCDANGNSIMAPAAVVTQGITQKPLRTSKEGVEFIKGWEKYEPNLYSDDWGDPNVVGNCTIGYGYMIHPGECNGGIDEQPFINGISEDQATELLSLTLEDVELEVNESVIVDLTQYQFDALVSFAYNVGTEEDGFGGSDLLIRLNSGDYKSVPSELLRWVYPEWAKEGLTRRRTEEGIIFSSGVYP